MGERQRFLPREGMPRRHDENKALLPAGDGTKSGARLGIGDQPQIGTSILDGIINFIGLSVINRHFDARMGLSELLENGRQVVKRDADDAGNAEFAAEFAAGHSEECAEALIAVEDIAAGLEVDMSLGREGEVVVAPVDERHAEKFLHRADLLTHSALRDPTRFGGSRKAARVAKVTEDLEALDMHGQSLP
jgi:hypothetical protein